MKTTTQPWRIVELPEEGGFEIWTREDDTPGSRNNYAIATGIQDEREAVMLASAPRLLEEWDALLDALKDMVSAMWQHFEYHHDGDDDCDYPQRAIDKAREIIAKATKDNPINQAMDMHGHPAAGWSNE